MSYVFPVCLFLVAANSALAGYTAFDEDIQQPRIGWLLIIAAVLLAIAGVKLWP